MDEGCGLLTFQPFNLSTFQLFNQNRKDYTMKKYVCKVCGYVYDPENNNGVAFEDLPEDWTCPMCGVGKDQFEEM